MISLYFGGTQWVYPEKRRNTASIAVPGATGPCLQMHKARLERNRIKVSQQPLLVQAPETLADPGGEEVGLPSGTPSSALSCPELERTDLLC